MLFFLLPAEIEQMVSSLLEEGLIRSHKVVFVGNGKFYSVPCKAPHMGEIYWEKMAWIKSQSAIDKRTVKNHSAPDSSPFFLKANFQ